MAEWAPGEGLSVDEIVTEVGSGMNGKRRKLGRVLADPSAVTLVVEHRDRLARFGVEYLEAALSAAGQRVVVVTETEVDTEVAEHCSAGAAVTEVLTSFCARAYGRRGARNRALKALGCAKADVGPMALARPGGLP